MELFFELLLTVSLSLIITSLFAKLVSMQPNKAADSDNFTKEALKIDKFQHTPTPFREEVIELGECPSEGKSSVELCNVVGVDKEDKRFKEVAVDGKEGETEEDGDGSKEENGGGSMCEIEIESVKEDDEEDEQEIGIMDDWEEIGRKDFEELLGNKAGLYNVNVDYEK